MHRNEILCRQWVDEVWNKQRIEMIDELFAENGSASYPYLTRDDHRLTGRQQYKEFVSHVSEHFTRIKIEISDITADDEKVVAVCTIDAIPRDSSKGRLNASSLCLYKIADGRISEIWNNVELANADLQVLVKQ